MLRILRISLASLCFAGLCLLFLDVSGLLSLRLALLAKIQFIPALLSENYIVVAALVVLTLLFGRIYCSILCPLGVLQDLLTRLGKKQRFRFSSGKTWLRVAALNVFVLALLTGATLLFSILEPYSAFGRIATNLLAPVWQSGSNILALASERAGNFLVGPTPVWQKGISALTTAILTLGVIGILALRSGRTWCNTICPVGAFLGLVSRFSYFRFHIDSTQCAGCGVCAKTCKASCINAQTAVIDASRCVACYNCLGSCRRKAIAYSPQWPAQTAKAQKSAAPDPALRALLTAGLSALVLPAVAAARNPDENAPDLSRKQRPARETLIIPPGSSNLRAFAEHCTGCQLCVSVCPHQVLSACDQGADVLHPAMSFERGFCRVNCVSCSLVCPTGAIRAITVEEKSVTQIGRALADWKRCIVNTDKVECTACSRACPTGAAALIGRKAGPKWLTVDPERCIGCGACEYVCPVHPVSAIRVEGNLEHRRV